MMIFIYILLIALAVAGSVLVRKGIKWGVALPIAASLIATLIMLAPSGAGVIATPPVDPQREMNLARAIGKAAAGRLHDGASVLVIGRNEEGGAQLPQEWSAALSAGAGVNVRATLSLADDTAGLSPDLAFDLLVILVDGTNTGAALNDVAMGVPVVLAMLGDKPRLDPTWQIDPGRLFALVYERKGHVVSEPAP